MCYIFVGLFFLCEGLKGIICYGLSFIKFYKLKLSFQGINLSVPEQYPPIKQKIL